MFESFASMFGLLQGPVLSLAKEMDQWEGGESILCPCWINKCIKLSEEVDLKSERGLNASL